MNLLTFRRAAGASLPRQSCLWRGCGIGIRLSLVLGVFTVAAYYFREDLKDSAIGYDLPALADPVQTGNISPVVTNTE